MKRSAGTAVFILLSCLLQPSRALPQQVSLTILHTNDTHGHLLPFSYPSVGSSGSEMGGLKVRKNIGGIARRATLVKRLREDLNRAGTTVWLVDAGDFSEGTPFSTEYHGEADIAAMNAANYDFGALGNHEFNNPLARLKNLLRLFRFPVLCANAIDTSTGRPLTRESEIRIVGPLKVGIFGLVTYSASGYPASREGVTISGEIKTAQRMANALRPTADIVIAISHSGEKVDEQIAERVPGVDVIVGGHSHSRLPSGELVQHLGKSDARKIHGTIIVQAHQWGGELGRLDIVFSKDAHGVWQIERYQARLIPVTPDIPEDKTVAAVVARYWEPIAARSGEIIGRAESDFVARGNDLAHYHLTADAIRETFGTEIEFENIGGVRSELIKGKIVRADLVNMDPFENTIVTFKIRGRRLKEVLLKTQPAVSGIRYRIEHGKLVQATVSGEPVDDARFYSGAANSYFARTALKGITLTDSGRQRLDVLVDYVRKKGTVKPSYDGRRVVIQPARSQNRDGS